VVARRRLSGQWAQRTLIQPFDPRLIARVRAAMGRQGGHAGATPGCDGRRAARRVPPVRRAIGTGVNTQGLTIEDLRRWALAGAHRRVVDISGERAVVDLCACTGEPMERVESDDPAVIGYLRTGPSGLEAS
jgi:hypothetical protein